MEKELELNKTKKSQEPTNEINEINDIISNNEYDNNSNENLNINYEISFEEYYINWEKLNNIKKFQAFYLFSKEFSKQFLPLAFVFCFYIVITISNILFISHSNKEALLNGVGLGLSVYNMIAISVSLGISSALDTFCPHAYGARQYRLMGCYLNRAKVILLGMYVFIAIFLFYIAEILISINQKEDVSKYAGLFCKGLLPGLILFSWADSHRRFLQAQNIVIEPVLCVIVTSIIHPFWIYLFTHVFDFGAFGNGLSISVTNLLNFILVLIVTKYKTHPESIVNLFIKESFTDIAGFFNIALPTLFMICLESWNYEIITLMSGYLKSEDQRNSHIILVNFGSIIYMFPFALGITSSNIIGKYVGGFYPGKTELVSKFILIFASVLSFVLFIILILSRSLLPKIFSSNQDIVEIVDKLLVYYFFYQFFDFITTTFCGIFRGLGMQKMIAIANFVCFYIISLPLNYYLTFTLGFEVYGIRITYNIVIFLLFVVYCLIYRYCIDFNKICDVTKTRLIHDQNNIFYIEELNEEQT